MSALGAGLLAADETALALRGRDHTEFSDADLMAAMLVIRRFEERVRDLRVSGDISGSVHLEIGQEAIAVGALVALGADDAVFSTYRGHGWALASGSSLVSLFAGFLGRDVGVNGGRGGSAYLSDVAHAFYGENSIVGAGAPIACGAALAATFDGSRRVALTVFGDGAMNQGAVSEALNFASALSLPVIFVCENNRYSELTLIEDVVASTFLHERGAPYRIPHERIDGNDARAVAAAVGGAAARARDGGGPALIEAMTERLVGHYIGDAEQYRLPGEVEAACADEPIARLAAILPGETVESVSASIGRLVLAASDTALARPLADPNDVLDHVYAAGPASA